MLKLLLLWSILLSGKVFSNDSLSSNSDGVFRARLNSASFLPYSGKILSNRPALDILLAYNWKFVSVYAFQSVDIRSTRSDINYFQLGFFRNLKFNEKWKITPYAVIEVPQNGVFYDSPYWITGMSLAYAPSPAWEIENTTLLADGFKSENQKDILNRLKISYTTKEKWEWTSFIWSNSDHFDKAGFITSGFMLTVPALLKPEKSDLRISFMYFQTLSKDKSIHTLDHTVNATLIWPLSF